MGTMKIEDIFKKDLSFGKRGEAIMQDYLQENLSEDDSLLNVSDDEKYQDMDIDFLITSKNACDTMTLELKTDSTMFSNFFVETISNKKIKSRGWYKKTKADVIIYFFKKKQKAYFFRTDSLKAYINQHSEKLKLKNCKCNGSESQGYIVPVYDFMEYVNEKGEEAFDCFIPWKHFEAAENE